MLDRTINDRGFHVDRSFAEAARRIAQAATPEIDAELAEITGGAVAGINQIAKQVWLREQGCKAKKLDKKAIEKLMTEAELLPPAVQRVLELRKVGRRQRSRKSVRCWHAPALMIKSAGPSATMAQRLRQCGLLLG